MFCPSIRCERCPLLVNRTCLPLRLKILQLGDSGCFTSGRAIVINQLVDLPAERGTSPLFPCLCWRSGLYVGLGLRASMVVAQNAALVVLLLLTIRERAWRVSAQFVDS